MKTLQFIIFSALCLVGSLAEAQWNGYLFSNGFEAGEDLDASDESSLADLRLESPSEDQFATLSSPVTFRISTGAIDTSATSFRVYRNGATVSSSQVQLTSQTVVLNSVLTAGLNSIVVLGRDTNGKTISSEAKIWAGNNTVTVNLRDEAGSIVSNVPVRIELADAPAVARTLSTVNGSAIFQNVPSTTISITARGPSNSLASASTTGNVGSVLLTLKGFRLPSAINNNDFSLGLAGWDIGTAPVTLIPHNPGGGGVTQDKLTTTIFEQKFVDSSERSRRKSPELAGDFNQKLAQGSNSDLMLSTSGIGGQSISRTFAIAAGIPSVRARFRFITSEVPGGFFGSQYNDHFSVSIRSSSAGGSISRSNSMNSLGLAAFDSNGATAWYTVDLPVAGSDTIQVDATVSNIGDGAYDSAVVLDFIEESPLRVTSNIARGCPNQTVTLQAQGSSTNDVSWSGGGSPATATGPTFTTRFSQPGSYRVEARRAAVTVTETITILEASGPQWHARFPTSTSTNDLIEPFRTNANRFISAMRAAMASVSVAATFRPSQRAYLMHYSFRIANGSIAPEVVPSVQGVNICWVHRDGNGNVDVQGSRGAAEAMVDRYDIRFLPSLQSRHTQGRAIDMTISWLNSLLIQTASGGTQSISSLPRSGANTELHAVGSGYGVQKLVADPPHWSDDGR